MKISRLFLTAASLAVLSLFGCGGGGGGAAPPPTSATITGAVMLGPVSGADVTIYAINANGTVDRSAAIGTGKTAGDGRYSISIPTAPTGSILVEATGGTYTDEASAKTGVPLTATLHALVASVKAVKDGDNKVAVTPLTELAFHQAGGIGGNSLFTVTVINDANAKIGSTFSVDNIITSTPFDPTTTAPAGATADDKRYAAAVGIFSQLVENRKGTDTTQVALVKVIQQLEAELETNGGYSSTTLSGLNTAITDFTPKNKGGTVPAPITFTSGVLQISTAGTLAAGTVINGIDVTVTLPAGVTVKADALGEVSTGVLIPSSVAATNSTVSGKYTPASGATLATLRIILLNVQPGVTLGEFLHVNFDGFPSGTDVFSIAVTQISGSTSPTTSPATLTGVTTTFTDAGF